MPYFDGCEFDPTYFDASECVAPPAPEGSRIARSRQWPRIVPPVPVPDEEDELLFLLDVL